jgi:hypothetical protein
LSIRHCKCIPPKNAATTAINHSNVLTVNCGRGIDHHYCLPGNITGYLTPLIHKIAFGGIFAQIAQHTATTSMATSNVRKLN